MAWHYHIDATRGLVISTASGDLTGLQTAKHQIQLRYDPRFRHNFFQLIDLTRVTAIDIGRAVMRVLAYYDIFSRNSRRAIVATNPSTLEASHLFISFRKRSGRAERIQVFSDRNAAMQWLFSASLDKEPAQAA